MNSQTNSIDRVECKGLVYSTEIAGLLAHLLSLQSNLQILIPRHG